MTRRSDRAILDIAHLALVEASHHLGPEDDREVVRPEHVVTRDPEEGQRLLRMAARAQRDVERAVERRRMGR